MREKNVLRDNISEKGTTTNLHQGSMTSPWENEQVLESAPRRRLWSQREMRCLSTTSKVDHEWGMVDQGTRHINGQSKWDSSMDFVIVDGSY